MKLLVGTQAGFCFGVRKAVDAVEERLGGPGKIFMLGPVINNPRVVSSFEERGVRVVMSPEEIDEADATVIIRSHGVPPAWIEAVSARFDVLDLTCPHVMRAQKIVSEADGAVIIAGEAGHPEVVGLCGCCENTYVVLELSDVDALPSMEKATLISQTTLSLERFGIIREAVSRKVRELDVHNTICGATSKRREEARGLSSRADAMIVVGGRTSSNTMKLYELCASICARTVLVESKDELSPADFIGCGVVGITAGASTPDCTIKEVVTYMNDNDNIQPIADTTEAQATPAEQATPVESAAPVEPATPVESSAPAEEPQEMIDSGADVNFTTAFEQTMVSIRPGQTVNGKIVQIREEEVCVNIGYKSDGIVKRSDLVGDGELKIGDEIEVEVVKVNDGEGNVILSQRNIINRKNWDAISTAFDNGEFVGGVGKEAVKGGLLATVMGIRTFIPASQLSLRYVEKIEDFVGKDMKLKIIEVDKQKKRIVASAKAVLIEEESMRKKQIWGKLTVGEVITGTVRRLTDFGAFVDIGGVDGLVHVADLSWGRVKHPSDVVAVNQEIQVKIMNVDEEKERVSLGYKQLQPKPWDVAGERYPAGAIVTGKVVRIVNFGAFVELEPGLDGLVHISQCAPTRIDKVEDAVTVGDYVRVKILSIEPDNKRISLSIRDAMSEEEGQYEIPVEDTSEEPTAYVEADPDSMEEPQDEEPEAEAVQTEEAGDEVQPE